MRDFNLDVGGDDDREKITKHCTGVLISMVAESGADSYRIQANGVSRNGVELGDWLITVEHIPSRMAMN